MPIYEYHCNKCGANFELLIPRRKTGDAASCEECGATDTRRVVSTFSGHVKPDISQAKAFADTHGGARKPS
jgi:putative FmdB family regulatory protein